MENKKTILFLTSRFPFPLEKGDKLRAYHQIKELSKIYNIILCSITTANIEDSWKDKLRPFCKEIYIFKLNPLLLYWNTFKMIFSKLPFQVGYFYQSSIKNKILKIVKQKSPDILYCQLIRTTEYVKHIHNIPKTLDYMDALSAGMEKRAKIANWIKKQPLKIEGKRLKIYENKIFDYFDHHTIISKQDQKLISHPLNQKITIVPNGIDDYFLQYTPSNLTKEYDLVFVGNLNYAPNIEGCLFIVNELLPFFKKSGKDLTVLLSGANPSPKILKLNQLKNVTVIGWVDDIRESYSKGTIFVAPLFIGTGLQNKLLEAMSLNVPCITTSLVNNALGAEPNSEIIIADSAIEFYNQINIMLKDSSLTERISMNAKKFVAKNYSWKKETRKINF